MIDRPQAVGLVDPDAIPPLADPALGEPLQPRPGINRRDRIVGSLVGCALGDALGRPNEGKAAHHRIPIAAFDPDRSGISDDTQLTIEIGRNLVANAGAFDPVSFGRQLVEWLPRAVGIGAATLEAVNQLARGVAWHQAGSRSAGNGAAMRVAPIGLVHATDVDRLRLDAAISAVVTHHDPTAAASSVAMAYATAWCAAADPASFDPERFLTDVDAALADLADPGIEPRHPGRTGPTTVRAAIAAVAGRLDADPIDFFVEHWSGALVTESLPAALWCLLRSPADPPEAIRPGAELARDADTVAAMTGALAGALHGVSGLPTKWVKCLPGDVIDELTSLGSQLADLVVRR